MTPPVQIAPSILSANFLNLEKDVALLACGRPAPEWLHVDVMDGHFVPNLSIGPPFVRALKQACALPLDVHLMIDNPVAQLDWYLQAGADLVTLHVECAQFGPAQRALNASASAQSGLSKGSSFSLPVITEEGVAFISSLLARVRAAGALAGIALNPDTPVSVLEPLLGRFDLALVMSVHPGFGGQSFIKSVLEKIATLARWRDRRPVLPETPDCAKSTPSGFLIEVDGGINAQTAALVVAAGADILVAGNAIFTAPDPLAALAALRVAARS